MEKMKLVETAILHRPKPLSEAEGDGAEKDSGKWTASVWKLDEINLNGRIYSTELAMRMVKENRVTTANDGHWADSASEYACAKAVCDNPRIEHGELVVDINFIDKEYEERLSLLANKGVAIGVSSVGWGEMDETGRIVPETYELVRWLDFVSQPAGEVYAHKESEQSKEPKAEKEKTVVKPSASEVSESSRNLAKDIIFRRRMF